MKYRCRRRWGVSLSPGSGWLLRNRWRNPAPFWLLFFFLKNTPSSATAIRIRSSPWGGFLPVGCSEYAGFARIRPRIGQVETRHGIQAPALHVIDHHCVGYLSRLSCEFRGDLSRLFPNSTTLSDVRQLGIGWHDPSWNYDTGWLWRKLRKSFAVSGGTPYRVIEIVPNNFPPAL